MTTITSEQNTMNLFDPTALRLSEPQRLAVIELETVLKRSNLRVARVLINCEQERWTADEMREVEHEILQRIGKGAQIQVVLNTFAKVIQQHASVTGLQSPSCRQVVPIQLEPNPLEDVDLVRAERLLTSVTTFVSTRARTLASSEDESEPSPSLNIALAVLWAVAHFDLLHESMLVALVEAIRDRSRSFLHQKSCCAYLLSLSWKGEPDSQAHLYVPDMLAGALIERVSQAQVETVFAKSFAQLAPGPRYNSILKEIRDLTVSLLKANGIDSTLQDLLKAARCHAYFHMPATVAAQRCRKFITHAPRYAVLRRLMYGEPVQATKPVQHGRPITTAEIESLDAEIGDISAPEPAWHQEMRDAFKLASPKKILAALSEVREKSGPAGARIVGFAISMLSDCEVSTTERYGLLIARRLGMRMYAKDPKTLHIHETDPAALSAEKLEDVLRDVLNDDWNDISLDEEQNLFRRNKRVTVEAVLGFLRYLRQHCGVGPLPNLAPFLKRRGLLPVDANFITIDDFLKVLAYVSGPQGIHDPYMRSVIRLIIIVSFRCGLRRGEVFYLRAQDLDVSDHLHIRSNDFFSPKTTSSHRAVPAGILMCRELSEFRHFVQQRMAAPRSDKDLCLIFSQQNDASVPLNIDRVFTGVNTVLRRVLNDETIRTHHLRHSFATLLLAKLSPNTAQFVRDFLPHHPELLRWLEQDDGLREALFGNADIDDLDVQAIAHLLGHGDCSTAPESYLHCYSWLGSSR